MARISSNAIVMQDREEILEEIDLLGVDELFTRIQSADETFEFLLIEKLVTFADVPGYGKCCTYSTKDKNHPNAYKNASLIKRAKQNYLFYKSTKEIVEIEKKSKANKVFFNQTKQTNIHLPLAFYEFIGRKDSRKERNYDINSGNVHCFLVNSTLRDTFSKEITDCSLDKLGKEKKAQEYNLASGEYTNLSIHVAAHGIGTDRDALFHKVRGNVFATDKICILLEKSADEINVFISFFRNPIFYKLNNLMMNAYLMKAFEKVTKEKEPEESRRGQSRWRETLAEYAISMENGAVDYVICPFTHVKVKYPSEATLLRASHIKAYAKCRNRDNKIDISQAYDVDNGFLVTANVDALFDKYYITVDCKTGKIIWSKEISEELRKSLNITDKIEKKYYETKKEYLRVHNQEFNIREEKRRR